MSLSSSQLSPQLPFGDINVVVLTDVHSWVAGHGRHEQLHNADFGDVLSFYEHLKSYCDEEGKDLWFVSNGDWAHGTGLGSPAYSPALVPLLEKMPWDAVNCGNHELYEHASVNELLRPGGMVDWFGDNYLTANIRAGKSYPLETVGNKFKLLRGKNSNLMVFGFLYDMGDANGFIDVARVEEVVQEQWFEDALIGENYDAVMVLAHMDLVDPLVYVIRDSIRQIVGDRNLPIQFITGHTHYRGEKQLDGLSSSVEAGRYLDTVGFVSFPNESSANNAAGKDSFEGLFDIPEKTADMFQHKFLDANKEVLAETLGIQDMTTSSGAELSKFILKTQEKLGFLEEIGCAPRDYHRNVPLEEKDSLWGLFRDEVAPKAFFSQLDQPEVPSAMFLSAESFRSDLLSSGKLVVDDMWAIAPFNDTVMHMGSFSGKTILKLNQTIDAIWGNTSVEPWGNLPVEPMRTDERADGTFHPKYFLIGDVEEDVTYRLYAHEFGSIEIAAALQLLEPSQRIEPLATRFTSTFIWLSYVIQNWSCGDSPREVKDLLGGFFQGDMSEDEPIPGETTVTLLIVFGSVAILFAFIFGGGFVQFCHYSNHIHYQNEEVIFTDTERYGKNFSPMQASMNTSRTVVMDEEMFNEDQEVYEIL